MFCYMKDVNSYMVELLGVGGTETNPHPVNPLNLEELKLKLTEVTAADVTNKSGKNIVLPIKSSKPISELVVSFANSVRVPVVDDSGTFLRVVSPIDFINVLKSEGFLEAVQTSKEIPLSLALGQKPVRTINEDDTLFKVMTIFHNSGFSAIPVVDSNDPLKVLSVISVRDLQGLLLPFPPVTRHCISESALSFQTSIKRFEKKSHFPFMHVCQSSTLQAVIAKLQVTHVHRILLMDSEQRLTGVVSFPDICQLFVRHICS
eukprot:GHVR01009305.1.p1 GENE.GHVR01009305.1~~GHVR01009305.1.p1  ORF type:complete len:261 (+),score=42.81 GHVR01009305.1:271-1053(+)